MVEATVNRARGRYQRAARKGLWAEVRLDYLEEAAPDLPKLFRSPARAGDQPQPAGRGRGALDRDGEADRLALLAGALNLGVTCLDLELAADAGWRREVWARRGPTKLILSWHDFGGTPEVSRLEAVLEEMLAAEADIVKLVTLAREPADNLRMLSLIPLARARGKEIIAFCMGPLGKWSRVAAPLVGSWLSFAPFSKTKASAPGQLTVNDLKRVWKTLK